MKRGDDNLRDELLQRLIDSRLVTPYVQVNFNHEPSKLPVRELPHSSWAEMYLLYKAYTKTTHEACASRATFFKSVSKWKVCLKFHQKTHHAQCATCARYRSALHRTDEPCHSGVVF